MHKAVSVRPGMHRGLWEDRDGKGHPKHTEKYSSKREAFSWFGSWWGCRGARNPRMGWGGHRMIDFRCISVEDLTLPSASTRARHVRGRRAGKSRNASQAPPPPQLSANHRKASPSRSAVSRRTPSAAGERHPSQPGPSYREVAEHAQLPGRGG